jgi:hypothetical protein
MKTASPKVASIMQQFKHRVGKSPTAELREFAFHCFTLQQSQHKLNHHCLISDNSLSNETDNSNGTKQLKHHLGLDKT